MAGDLISMRTRQEFREYFVGTSLLIIGDAFDAEDIACDTRYSPPWVALRGADAMRQLLSQLGSMAQNVAELCSLYGTGHGKDGGATGLKPRRASDGGLRRVGGDVPVGNTREPPQRHSWT